MYPRSISSWRLRWPLLVCLLIVLAMGTVVLIASDLRSPDRAAGKAVFARAGLAQPRLSPPRVAAGNALGGLPANALVTENAAQPGSGEAEVCGLGIVKVSERDPSGADQVPERARQDTWDRLRAVFAASDDERLRAIGFLLDARSAEQSAAAPRDALARLAAGSSDSLVYALAIEACKSLDTQRVEAGACQLVSAEQWTRVDPHNAVPWLSLASLARERKDAAGEAEAVYRASLAQVSDSHAAVLPKMISQALPPDLAPIGRTIALVDAYRAQAAFHQPAHRAASRYCAADAVADSNLSQVCEQLATLLIDRGRALPDPLTGRTIGERVGWPAQRVQELQDEQQALMLSAVAHTGGNTALNCENVTRLTQWAAQASELGEFGAMRELLKRSGKSMEQALAEYRQRVQAGDVTAGANTPGMATRGIGEATPADTAAASADAASSELGSTNRLVAALPR